MSATDNDRRLMAAGLVHTPGRFGALGPCAPDCKGGRCPDREQPCKVADCVRPAGHESFMSLDHRAADGTTFYLANGQRVDR